MVLDDTSLKINKLKNYIIMLWIGAAIAAAGALGSALLANHQAKKTRSANEKLANKEFEQNKEMWNLQNQYNSPSAQAARLKAAGINPAVQYGSGNVVGNSDSVPALDYSGAQSPAYDYSSSISQGLSAAQQFIQAKVSNATVQKANAEIKESQSRALLNEINAQNEAQKTPWIAKDMEAQLAMHRAQTDEIGQNILAIQANIGKTQLECEGMKLANQLFQDTYDQRVQSYSLQNDLTDSQIHEVNKKMQMYDAEIAQLKASAYQLMQLSTTYSHQNRLTRAQEVEINQLARNYKAEYDGIVARSGLSQKELNWYVGRQIAGIGGQIVGTAIGAATGIGALGAFSKTATKIGY